MELVVETMFYRTGPFFLFFWNHVALLDLHSFPTRRSSDLNWACSALRLSPASPTSPASVSPRKLDRKSTRLNSSHRCISYAVFCLKKKRVLADPLPRARETHLRERRTISHHLPHHDPSSSQ